MADANFKYLIKPFNELTTIELYEMMKLRQEVFIVEQDCAYLDADGLDQKAVHVLGYHDGNLISYARALPPSTSYEHYSSVGRVIVKQDFRRRGLGEMVMHHALQFCLNTFGVDVKISAQCYALSLYEKMGFESIGASYLEDGIPHQAMLYKRSNPNNGGE